MKINMDSIDLARLIYYAQRHLERLEKRKQSVLRANLPSFIKNKPYKSNVKYTGYIVSVRSIKKESIYATIAETVEELAEHIEVIFGKSINQLQITPLEVSQPMPLKEATEWLLEKIEGGKK